MMISEPLNQERSRGLLPIYVTTAGCNHHQEPRYRPRGAVFHHILFVEEGSGVFETETERYVLQKNSAVFIRKEYPIRYYAQTEDFTTAWVTFDGKGVEDLLAYFGAEGFSVCQNSSLYSKILSCVKLYRRIATADLLSRAAYDLVVSYFSEFNALLCPEPMVKAKRFIEEHFHRDLSVSEIAHAAGISPSMLYRLFKEKENMTPVEMIRTVRIQNAKLLLLSHPEYRSADVAELCGFSDAAYFCKVFKSETGLSPYAFRNTYET